MLLFYKTSLRFIWGHVLAHLLYPLEVSCRRSEYFFLRFMMWPFSGLVDDMDSTPMVPDLSITVRILSVCVCLFLQSVCSNTLAFWENIEDSDPFLRVPFDFLCVQIFQRTSKLLSNAPPILLQVAEDFHSYILRGLWYCCWVFDRRTTCLAALLWYLSRTLVPCDDRGSKFLGCDRFATAIHSPESFLPAFCFHFLVTDKG